LLAGVFYSLDISGPFYLDLVIKAGRLKSVIPELRECKTEYMAYSSSAGIRYDTMYTFATNYEIPIKWSLQYAAAVKLKYSISQKILLQTSLDYFYSNAKAGPTSESTIGMYIATTGWRTPESNSSVIARGWSKQRISTMNLSFGLQWNIR